MICKNELIKDAILASRQIKMTRDEFIHRTAQKVSVDTGVELSACKDMVNKQIKLKKNFHLVEEFEMMMEHVDLFIEQILALPDDLESLPKRLLKAHRGIVHVSQLG